MVTGNKTIKHTFMIVNMSKKWKVINNHAIISFFLWIVFWDSLQISIYILKLKYGKTENDEIFYIIIN